MHPNAYQNRMLEQSRARSEQLARIEAEQLRQAEALALIIQQLEVIAADRPKRSTAKS